ncbi:hypothetical protein DFH94DRAFT_697144 [Russula ochroleuca]|uniref:Uncharacterized protein n=1 Tax=Russula ochroleuca TaxID=152965 RepID=A0A9P5MP40_9AGAM|nr:hypothetical protein DFH94DRAFT_697144 [Russula ochroleuca]
MRLSSYIPFFLPGALVLAAPAELANDLNPRNSGGVKESGVSWKRDGGRGGVNRNAVGDRGVNGNAVGWKRDGDRSVNGNAVGWKRDQVGGGQSDAGEGH